MALLFLLPALSLSAQLPCCTTVRAGGQLAISDSIIGPWEMTGHDSFFELVRSDGTGHFDLVILDSPAADMPHRTTVGRLIPLADKNKYDLELTAVDDKGNRKRQRAFILTFSPDYSSLSLQLYNRYRSVSIDRLFPYLFRIGFSKSDPRPNNIDGARNLNFQHDGELVL